MSNSNQRQEGDEDKTKAKPKQTTFDVNCVSGDGKAGNANSAAVQYINNLNQSTEAGRPKGLSVTVDEEADKLFLKISAPVRDGHTIVNVLCDVGIVKDFNYKLNKINKQNPKHMTKLHVNHVPPIVDTMQTHNEAFFGAVDELEKNYKAELTQCNKGCLYLEFEHTSEKDAKEMVADKFNVTRIFKDFAEKCGFPAEEVTVKAEYELLKQPGQEQADDEHDPVATYPKTDAMVKKRESQTIFSRFLDFLIILILGRSDAELDSQSPGECGDAELDSQSPGECGDAELDSQSSGEKDVECKNAELDSQSSGVKDVECKNPGTISERTLSHLDSPRSLRQLSPTHRKRLPIASLNLPIRAEINATGVSSDSGVIIDATGLSLDSGVIIDPWTSSKRTLSALDSPRSFRQDLRETGRRKRFDAERKSSDSIVYEDDDDDDDEDLRETSRRKLFVLPTRHIRLPIESGLLTIFLDLQSDPEKMSFEATRNLCGLRNSGGGGMKIYSKKKEIYTDFYDRLLPQCMNACLVDDEFSDDVYTIKEENGVTTIDAERCSKLVTCDYYTKITLENNLINPTRRQVKQLMQRSPVGSEAKIRGQSRDLKNGKTVAFKQQKDREIVTDPSQFVKRLFVDLNLREYITAFSQNKDGGSYLLEIELHDKQTIQSVLHQYIREHLVVLEAHHVWSIPPDDLTRIVLHKIEDTKRQYLLEVSVRPFYGIVFYDRRGPESYKINEQSQLVRLTKEEWLARIIYDS